MTWSLRGERSYFYRHVREGGQRRKVYIGTGPTAELLAQVDQERYRVREQEQRRHQDDKKRLSLVDAAVSEFDRLVHRLVEARLLLAGFYRHDRGRWRKRRLSR